MDHGFEGLGSGSVPEPGVTYTPSFDFGDSFDCPSLTADLQFTQVISNLQLHFLFFYFIAVDPLVEPHQIAG
jgi:hypothetical protein